MNYMILHFRGAIRAMRKDNHNFCLVEAGWNECFKSAALYPMHTGKTLKDCLRVKHESVIALTIPEMEAVLRGVDVEDMFLVHHDHYRS